MVNVNIAKIKPNQLVSALTLTQKRNEFMNNLPPLQRKLFDLLRRTNGVSAKDIYNHLYRDRERKPQPQGIHVLIAKLRGAMPRHIGSISNKGRKYTLCAPNS